MQTIVPAPGNFEEVVDLLNHWDITPRPSEEARCPKCGGKLTLDNLYCGGRGYQPYAICQSEGDCDYMKRMVN